MGLVPEYTKRAQENYRQKVKQKQVTFNIEKPEEMALYTAVEADNVPFSALVKQLLTEHYKTTK